MITRLFAKLLHALTAVVRRTIKRVGPGAGPFFAGV
jgi:hypothetical protein